jgi:hypothetical protein
MLRRVLTYSLMLFVCLLISGCTSVVLVDPEEPLDNDRVFNYDQANTRLTGEATRITCKGGRIFDCYLSEVRRDSTVFYGQLSHTREAVRTTDVLKVEYRNRGAGAFTGVVIGTLGGIGVGGIVIATSDGSADARMGAAVLFVGAIAGGAILGGVVGYLQGSTHEYRFKTVSPDSAAGATIPKASAP